MDALTAKYDMNERSLADIAYEQGGEDSMKGHASSEWIFSSAFEHDYYVAGVRAGLRLGNDKPKRRCAAVTPDLFVKI